MRKLVVTFFGLGYGPIAPATWGSFGAAVVFLGFQLILPDGVPGWALAAGVVLASAACAGLGPWAQKEFNANDPKPVVIDEVAGQWLSLLFVPVGVTFWRASFVTGAAFVLFRVFDILKPPPARQLERLPGGWGILFDDLAAGVMANVVLQGALWAILHFHLFGA